MKVDAKKKSAWFMPTDRCPYSGLPVTHPETFVCSDPKSDCRADMAKLGDRILIIKTYGYISSFAESEFQTFCDHYISRHFEVGNSNVYIEDYSGLAGGDAESRKKYIAYLAGLAGNKFFIAAVFYNLLPIYRLSVSLAQKLHLYGARAHAVHTYEQAMDLALKLINRSRTSDLPDHDSPFFAANIESKLPQATPRFSLNRLKKHPFFCTEKARRRLSEQYSEKLISCIASIDWQTPGMPGMPPPESSLSADAPSRKFYDAISFVKSEIDALMEERAAAEAILRESEAKYRLLVQHAKAGFLEYNYKTNRILAVNDEIVKYSGYSKEELLSMNPMDLFTEETRKMFKERVIQVLSGEPISQDIIYTCVTKNKEIRWLLLNSDVMYQNGRPDIASVVITDVTSIKQTESRLLEYQDKLKGLAIRLSRVEEERRRGIASHLHETIGQELFVLQLQLKSLGKNIDDPKLLKSLGPIHAQLLKIIKETKALTFDLSPPVLYDLGLKEALEALSANMASKHNIGIKTLFEGEMDAIADEIKAIIYRNIKELMHNTIKHAQAKSISIRLSNSHGLLYVDFHDDGIGFDTAKAGATAHNGFGLFDIREKLNHLGGHLTIDAIPGEGVAIYMDVPLDIKGNGEK